MYLIISHWLNNRLTGDKRQLLLAFRWGQESDVMLRQMRKNMSRIRTYTHIRLEKQEMGTRWS